MLFENFHQMLFSRLFFSLCFEKNKTADLLDRRANLRANSLYNPCGTLLHALLGGKKLGGGETESSSTMTVELMCEKFSLDALF